MNPPETQPSPPQYLPPKPPEEIPSQSYPPRAADVIEYQPGSPNDLATANAQTFNIQPNPLPASQESPTGSAYTHANYEPGTTNHGESNTDTTPVSASVNTSDPRTPPSTEPTSSESNSSGTAPSSTQPVVQSEVLSGGVENPTAHHGILGKLAIKLKIMH